MLHTLVLVTGPLVPPQTEATVEEGVNQVEEHASAIRDLRAQLAEHDRDLRAQLAEHERVMSERLQRVEGLLERVLAGMARNDSN